MKKAVKQSQDQPTHFWEKISLVADISARCRKPGPECQAFREVLEMIQRIIPFDAASLYLKEKESGHLFMHTCLEEPVSPPGFLKKSKKLAPGKWELRVTQPILWKNIPNQNDFDPDFQFATVLSAPLIVDDLSIGFLNLGSLESSSLQEKHVKLMSIVADQFAVSIERVKHINELKKQNLELEKTHNELRQAQQQIIAVEKMSAVNEIIASINHQINNPLAVIVGQTQIMLLDRQNLSPMIEHRLDRIEQAALRISNVNRRLLGLEFNKSNHLKGNPDKMISLNKTKLDNKIVDMEQKQ